MFVKKGVGIGIDKRAGFGQNVEEKRLPVDFVRLG